MFVYLVLLSSDTYEPFVDSVFQCETDAIEYRKTLFKNLDDEGLCIGIQKMKVIKTKLKQVK